MNPWPNPLVLSVTVPTAGIAVVLPSTGLFAAQPNSFVPCDTTAGQCLVQLPSTPADLTVVGLVDVSNAPGVNSILVEAAGVTPAGVITTVDPSWSGVGSRYGATGRVQNNDGAPVWLVFLQSLNAWVLAY